MTTVRRVERLLRQAIERRLEEGYGLQSMAFNLDHSERHYWLTQGHATSCAVGLFLIGHRRCGDNPWSDAATILRITTYEVSQIVNAFDIGIGSSPYADLGRRLRLDYYETFE